MRILMLPGYTQSASILYQRLGSIRKGLSDLPIELIFIDPTHIMNLPTTSSSASDIADPFDSNITDPANDPSLPRCWWHSDAIDGRRVYTHFDETILYLKRMLIQHHPIDGVFGFSQGAATAAILTALLERPHLRPEFLSRPSDLEAGIEWPPKPFKFGVFSSGFYPLDPRCVALFEGEQLKTPTLHVLGRGDTIVGSERSLPLADKFVNARVEWHDGGHFTPNKASWRTFFKAYIQSFITAQETGSERVSVVSPSGSGSGNSSEPNSGASTPASAYNKL